MKRPNLKIIGMDEGDFQLKGPEDIFNIIIEENFPKFPKVKKQVPANV